MESPIPRAQPLTAWLVLLLLGVIAALATNWLVASLRPAESDLGLGLDRPEVGIGTDLPGTPLRHAMPISVSRTVETRAASRDARRSAGTDAPELAQGIQGQVRDQLGNPVPGATVTIRTRLRGGLAAAAQGENASFEQRETTDAMGAFVIATLPTDDLELAVDHRDFALSPPVSPVRVSAGRFTELSPIVLTAGFTLSGIVRQLGSQAPVRNAVVEIVREQINPLVARAEAPRTTRTDAEGRFDLRGLEVGSHALSVSGVEGLAAVTLAAVEVPRQAPAPMIVELPRGVTWSGRVFASDGGGAIDGAAVTLYRRETEASMCRERQTDVRGEFRFADLEAARYRVRLLKAGYQPLELEELDLSRGQHALRFELTPRVPIDVVVTDATGRPATAARVELVTFWPERGTGTPCRTGGAIGTTDAQGRTPLPGPDPGSYAVLVISDDHAPTLSARFEYPGTGKHQVTVKLDAGGAVTGVVRNAAGQPVAHAVVEIGNDEGTMALAVAAQDPLRCTRTTRTAMDGSFRVTQLPPGVLARRVRHPDYVVSTAPVTVRSGAVTSLDPVVLDAGIKRDGMAFDDDGVPIRGGEVLAQRVRRGAEDLDERGTPATVRSCTDQNGAFTLAGLIPGTYEISVARTEPGPALRRFMDHLRSRTSIDVGANDPIRLQLRRNRPDSSSK